MSHTVSPWWAREHVLLGQPEDRFPDNLEYMKFPWTTHSTRIPCMDSHDLSSSSHAVEPWVSTQNPWIGMAYSQGKILVVFSVSFPFSNWVSSGTMSALPLCWPGKPLLSLVTMASKFPFWHPTPWSTVFPSPLVPWTIFINCVVAE